MPKISIIVPIYNSQNTLARCVDSILTQTYTDFELILINDGSTDGSSGICDAYKLKDSRVVVYHKANGGVSSARNCGLDAASGEYITFIDSDDWVEPNYLEDFFPISNYDFIANYYVAEGWYEWESCPFPNKEYDLDSMCEFLSSDFNKMNFICSKLFRNSIIQTKRLRFRNSIAYGEDTLFIYSYLAHSRNVKTRGSAVYHYDCHNVSSLSSSSVQWEKYECSINAICDVITEIQRIFHWDGYDARNFVVLNHFGKFIRELQMSQKVLSSANSLKVAYRNEHVRVQVWDRKTYYKSIGRKIFDCLMILHLFYLCAFLMMITYRGRK